MVGESPVAMVKKVFEGGRIKPLFNKMILVLIPKVVSPETITQFWPINHCTVPYKVLKKVIINCLKPIMPLIIA